MRTSGLSALVAFLVEACRAADAPRPRGVGPEFAKHYKSSGQFTCLFNPSIQLPLTSLNDDYCDCPDGSDEPGTAACAYLSPLSPSVPNFRDGANTTLALPGFYCKNKGHNPAYTPFTRVNDGVCDYDTCCDGSDEWAGVGGVKCPDKCKEIGVEWKKQDQRRKLGAIAASKRRVELVAEAKKARTEIEDWLKSSAEEITALEKKVHEFEKEKNEVEFSEKRRIVKSDGKGGKAGFLAGLAKGRLAVVKEGMSDMRRLRDQYKSRMSELEDILFKLKEEQQDTNDEKIREIIIEWETYLAKDRILPENDAQERDWEDMISGPDDIQWEEYEQDDADGDIEVLYRFEEYLPQPLKEWIDAKLRGLRLLLVQNGILAADDTASHSEESKAMKEARDRLTQANNELNNQKSQRTNHEEDLKMDFGPDDVFRPLKGKCSSLDSGEYTYELCWMDRVTQKPKKGGMQQGMGTFARFESMEVEEDVSPNGKGLGVGERMVMKFESGSYCWNGPQRSTVVIMACAEEDEVWVAVEEAKCEYRLEVGTAAVCEPAQAAGENGGKGGRKDEL